MSHVALYHCETEQDMTSVLQKIVASLGEEHVAALLRNKKVLLKPNVCLDFPPERGCTTHPAFVDAVIGLAKSYGAHVSVGDGPIVGVKGDFFGVTGIKAVCQKHGVPLLDFNRSPGKIIELDTAYALHKAHIAGPYFEADTIVNLPVLKSNMVFYLSGALKNMKGFLVGKEKHTAHYLGVSKCVADLNKMLRQDLVLMDGFIGMMGNFPIDAEAAHARLLIGGCDPVAVDALAAVLMGMRPNRIPMIRFSAQHGLGSSTFEPLGDPLSSFSCTFRKPAAAKTSPLPFLINIVSKFAFKRLQTQSKIVVNREKCIRCGRCVDACPFHAVSVVDNTVCIDHHQCDFCLCCSESCAHDALELTGPITRMSSLFKH